MEISEVSMRISTADREARRREPILASIRRMNLKIRGLGASTARDARLEDAISRRARHRAAFSLLGAKIQLEELLELHAPASEFACIQMRMGCCGRRGHADE